MKAIVTKYHSATNTRGSRISASDEDGNRISISYPHELSWSDGSTHRAAAEALCAKMKWTGNLAGGSLKNGYVFVFTEDATQELLDALHGTMFFVPIGTEARKRADAAIDKAEHRQMAS